MTVETQSLQLSSQGNTDIVDITNGVSKAVASSGIENGIVNVFCSSATSALTTIEFESGCVRDFQRIFDEIAASNRQYAHNARWHDGNGHSHVRAALLGPSLTVPFVSKRLMLGTWQQIIFVDFDNRPRKRELVIQMIGE